MWSLVIEILIDGLLAALSDGRSDPRREKRENPLKCICGYNLRGLTGREECPECRRPFNPHMRAIEESRLNAPARDATPGATVIRHGDDYLDT